MTRPKIPANAAHDAYRERTERERRLLFVALTRTRDGLWLGSRSDFIRAEHVPQP
jgi:superfamily I DNA/RNA helicase